MNSRTDVIKYCISHFGYRSYLEIGCKDDYTFSQINISRKVGVDPVAGGTIREYSDLFFKKNKEKFDIIFIDGDHRCRQAYRDIKNSLEILNEGGTIIAHDCNPLIKEDESIENVRCGDAWKSFVHFRQDHSIDSVVGNFDYGVGLIRKGKNSNQISLGKEFFELSWEDLVKNRNKWLNLLSADELKNWILSK